MPRHHGKSESQVFRVLSPKVEDHGAAERQRAVDRGRHCDGFASPLVHPDALAALLDRRPSSEVDDLADITCNCSGCILPCPLDRAPGFHGHHNGQHSSRRRDGPQIGFLPPCLPGSRLHCPFPARQGRPQPFTQPPNGEDGGRRAHLGAHTFALRHDSARLPGRGQCVPSLHHPGHGCPAAQYAHCDAYSRRSLLLRRQPAQVPLVRALRQGLDGYRPLLGRRSNLPLPRPPSRPRPRSTQRRRRGVERPSEIFGAMIYTCYLNLWSNLVNKIRRPRSSTYQRRGIMALLAGPLKPYFLLGASGRAPSGNLKRVATSRKIRRCLCMEAGASSVAESSESKWEAAIKKAKYGKPLIIEPEGEHLASIVFLHGLGDSCHGWSSALKSLPFKNIRWIVPTAPVRPVSLNHGFPCTAWFDVGSLSDDGPDDVEGLDTSAAFVATLLAKEPPNVKLAVGGFSMGGATSLFYATRSVIGKYLDGTPFTRKIDAAISLSGWLPAGKHLAKDVPRNNSEYSECAAKFPIFMGHGKNDFIVFLNYGEMSARALKDAGFANVTFKAYKGLDHSATPEELDDLCEWIKKELKLTAAKAH